MIGLAVEVLRREQHEAVDPARAERGVAALAADVARRACQADDRKAFALEKGQRVGVVVIAEADRRSQIILREDAPVPQALSQAARHTAGGEFGKIDPLGDAHKAANPPHAAVLDVGVGKKRALRRSNARHPFKGSTVALGKAEGGKKLKIMKVQAAQIIIGRLLHRRKGALQSGEKTDAERDDPQNGKISSQTAPDAPQEHFQGAAVHLLTIPIPQRA